MGIWDDRPGRDETLRRAIRDGAVQEAIATHKDALRVNDADRRLIHEIAQLAVHNALLRYSAEMAGDVARIESFERVRYDEAMMLVASPSFQALINNGLSSPSD